MSASESAHLRPAPKLRAAEVVAGYGGAPIVHGISVETGAGEIVSIVGPNGSGKSTLLKSLVGIAPIVAHQLLDEHVRSLALNGIAVLLVEQRARAALAISN